MSLNHLKQYNQDIRSWLQKVFAFTASIPKDVLVNRSCPVCDNEIFEHFASNDYLDYVRCSSCALIYMNPTFTENAVYSGVQGEDHLLMEYFNIISKYKTIIPPKPNPKTDSKLRDIYSLKPTGKLLDIGCSVGDFLHKAKHFYDVEGVEINPNTSRLAEQYFKIHKGFLKELCLPKVYDIVTLHQILYGTPNPVAFMRDIHNLLKDDGLLYINTPNSQSYAMELFRGKTNHLHGYTTLNIFNKESLYQLANKTGFKVLSFRTEWMDIYLTDLTEYLNNPTDFIHKRNCQIPDYEEHIRKEDMLQADISLDLHDRGNYIVAALGKIP